MSTQQRRAELLTFGYVNKEYGGTLPLQLIKLMQWFYDEYFYWILKDQKLQQFKNAPKNEKLICPRFIKIKGIKFNITLSIANYQFIFFQIEVQNWPENIEYIKLFREVKCEAGQQTISSQKILNRLTKSKTAIGGRFFCISQLKDINSVCFSILINVKCIKYTKDSNIKLDYYSPINTMQKHYTFTWNINASLMETIRKLVCKELLFSQNFDNDNWCAMLFPNGSKREGCAAIGLNCLHIPNTIKALDVKFACYVNNNRIDKATCYFSYTQTKYGFYDFMKFDVLKQKESISFTVELEIMNLYDVNDAKIKYDEWVKHGIDCVP
eukprot:199181_1